MVTLAHGTTLSTFPSAREIAAQIRRKEVSPVEVAQAHLDRIERLNPRLNAFVDCQPEAVLAQAREAEKTILRGDELGPLHGVPLSIKSSIDVAGHRCEAGSRLRAGRVAAVDAPLVTRLRAAGAVILGVTNAPELLMAWETDNLLYGRTNNPWDLSRTAGGSSGGEAAAIAAGLSAGGVGSDGGGSIRVPAHFCGICGVKPTPGRIPATGHFPGGGGAFAWIGVVGPMARTVADLRALFEVMAGPDGASALSAPVPVRAVKKEDVGRLRMGILESDALGKATPETTAAVERAARLLSEQGFAVETKRLNGLHRTIELWWYFFGPVIANIIREGDVGHDEMMSPMLREYVRLATAEMKLTYDSFLKACGERDRLRAEILRQMEEVTVLLSPVATGPAFGHGEGSWRKGAKENYRDTMRHSQWLNLAGFPGVAVPVGMSREGLPIGVQVIGRPYEDELVLAVAETIERGRGPWQAPSI